MLAVKTNRKQPLPASHSSAFNPEKQEQVAGYTWRLEPLRVRFISSDTITVQVNTTHLYTQNCTTRRTPCCSRLPGQISRGHFGSRIERQTRPRSSLQHVEREKSQNAGRKWRAGFSWGQPLPSSSVCRLTTERKAGQESWGLPTPHQSPTERRWESRCNR